MNYSASLESKSDIQLLCHSLADTLLAQRAEDGSQVFPTGGVRVFA
ncbi:MAG: 5-carboxymethyl-2-hydroxymuconate isomerase, partial [Stenotrophomonas sp.]